jgi:hypothetical protein
MRTKHQRYCKYDFIYLVVPCIHQVCKTVASPSSSDIFYSIYNSSYYPSLLVYYCISRFNDSDQMHASTADELVVDVEVAHLVALPVGVDLLEHRVEVQVQAAVAALVHDPRNNRRARRTVPHLLSKANHRIECVCLSIL